MKKDERDTDIQFWESLRYTAASGSAYASLVGNYPARAIETLEKVPLDIRGFAKVGFALKCPVDKAEIRDFCLAQIDGANKDFPQSQKPLSEKFSTWLLVIKIYSRFSRYSDAADSFDKIVKDLNQNPNDKKRADFHLSADKFSGVITSELLDLTDHALIGSVDRISDNRSRINAGLALLTITLKRLQELSIPRPA
jgi:tetratricopeptide (TPR) repeat protein